MNDEIREALKAHMDWVAQIADRINDGKLDVSDIQQIRQSDRCQIGQWLKSLELKCRDLPEYILARQTHDDFHLQAAKKLEEYQGGDRQESMKWLLQLGSTEGVSHDLLLSLVRLISKLDQGGAGHNKETKGRGWGLLRTEDS